MSTKELSPSKIVQNPRLWPSSFSRPVFSQKVCINTYIFKNGSDIQKFIQFVEGSFPNYVIDIKQNEDGSSSVSLTSSNTSASNDTLVIGKKYSGTCKLKSCVNKSYIYSKVNVFDGYVIFKTCKSNTSSTCTKFKKT